MPCLLLIKKIDSPVGGAGTMLFRQDIVDAFPIGTQFTARTLEDHNVVEVDIQLEDAKEQFLEANDVWYRSYYTRSPGESYRESGVVRYVENGNADLVEKNAI